MSQKLTIRLTHELHASIRLAAHASIDDAQRRRDLGLCCALANPVKSSSQ